MVRRESKAVDNDKVAPGPWSPRQRCVSIGVLIVSRAFSTSTLAYIVLLSTPFAMVHGTGDLAFKKNIACVFVCVRVRARTQLMRVVKNSKPAKAA